MVFSSQSDRNFIGASARDQVEFLLLIWVGCRLKKGQEDSRSLHTHMTTPYF